MTNHSPPIDGAIANGHQLVPLAPAALQKHGPVSALPQQDAPGQALTEPDRRGRRTIDGDTAIRVLAAIVVLAVAAFGAIVSYSHIFTLGHAHGQDGTAARLLPLSVDGLIAAASLVMLHAARRKLPVPRLARAMLVTGVIATVAANVLDGLPSAWISPVVSALIGAALSAWPAVAFIGCAEMVVQFVRDARHDSSDTRPAPVVTPRHDSDHDSRDDKPQRKRTARKPASALTGLAKAAAVLAAEPGLSNAEVHERTGVSVRTVQRARNGKTGSKP
jgi:hypothetical protein